MSERQQNAFTEFMERYGYKGGEDAPGRAVREVFGATPDGWQDDVLRAFGRRERRISIRSCHGPGKTALLAWISWIHILTRYPQKTAVTAPTSGQLYDAYYAEMKKWHGVLPPVLQSLVTITRDRIELNLDPGNSFLTAKTARPELPEALQGVHSDNVLLIADEASGIPEQIFEAASSSMSGFNATTILASNPVRTSGLFFDTHHKLSDMWATFHVGAGNSTRVSDDFVEDIARRYGVESNAYRIRVLGEFPRSDLDTIIPYELVLAAQLRDIEDDPDARPVWGLDVARFGDDRTALCKRYGHTLREPVRTWRGLDTMQVAGVVKAEYDSLAKWAPNKLPTSIMVDSIGIGSGVVDRLREMGLPVRGINVSETPSVGSRFANLRTELWFKAKDWFTARDCKIPADSDQRGDARSDFVAELVSTKYKIIDSNGRIRAESKADQKKRGLHSPDQADAFILTFAAPAATALFGKGWGVWNRAIRRKTKRPTT